MENRLDESIDHARRFAEQLENTAKKYDELQRSMVALAVSARSADGSVEVTVDSNGVPSAITLAEPTRGKDPVVVSAAIMECMRSAQAKLRQQVTNLVGDVVGNDAPAADMISRYEQRFPDPEPIGTPGVHDLAVPNPFVSERAYQPPTAESVYPPPPGPSPSRKPNRDTVVAPDEPDEDEQYYSRKSWLV
ncbi:MULTISPECIES: YbaB/EbfC family nucleoid-associated protein [unclassified Nocardia]|uniref:YbaB/EbfC family nucleoid-associated protein n=1 Tax=unclassified Nocardia TaxID=2637762 RepID=UPI0033B25C3F